MVSHELIVELQNIFLEEYGLKLSFAEAEELAQGLVDVFGILLDTSSLPVTSSK
jgi:hypothetical protein